MAVAHLIDAGLEPSALENAILSQSLRSARQLLTRPSLSPLTSSVGRLFDAVAAIAGIRHRVTYEGQAAIELEGLAARIEPDVAYPFGLEPKGDALILDCRPLVAAVAMDVGLGVKTTRIARRFQTSLVEMTVQTCNRIRSDTGLSLVALSGGVFLNALLTSELATCLEADGFRVLRHKQVPPGDGGLCLGQLAIAAAQTA
jgi:hydrogenase maturation protein HypF